MDKINFILDNLPDVYNKESESNLYKILNPIAKQLDEFLINLDEVKKAKFVDFAKGNDLDKIGSILNMKRFNNENDTSFRGRIKSRVPSFIGGGTVPAIKQVINNYLGVEPVIIEHYKPGEGHAYFDNGVLNGLIASIKSDLIVNISKGVWYSNGINNSISTVMPITVAANITNYIIAKPDGGIVSRTSSTLGNGEILIANIVTNASSITSIVDKRKILNPEENYITNKASITVQIPYSFETGNIAIEDVKNILRNTKAAGIALLIKIMETFNDSITIKDYYNTYFMMGLSGIGGSNVMGG